MAFDIRSYECILIKKLTENMCFSFYCTVHLTNIILTDNVNLKFLSRECLCECVTQTLKALIAFLKSFA